MRQREPVERCLATPVQEKAMVRTHLVIVRTHLVMVRTHLVIVRTHLVMVRTPW